MKNLMFLTGVILASLMISSCTRDNLTGNPDNLSVSKNNKILKEYVADRYIVVFRDEYSYNAGLDKSMNYEKRKEVMGKFVRNYLDEEGMNEVVPDMVYNRALHGFVATIAPGQVEKLKKDNRILFIEQDQVVTINAKPGGGGTKPPSQVVPWGVTRVGGFKVFTNTTTSHEVWIIDTGIDFTHPDLVVDITKARTFITTGKDARSATDYNGHGTHVAGIIGAVDNTIGVVGVAAGVRVVPVKVLDQTGNGTLSSVISGVDYVANAAQAGDVANMSLGTNVISAALDQAVLNASNAKGGIWFVIAAGNSGVNASTQSPADVNGPYVYTISAMDNMDRFASFSNFGNPPVDYAAPGVNIYSTYKGGSYATLSGTSMAAPHVAGILVSTGGTITTSGYVTGDKDVTPDPVAHR